MAPSYSVVWNKAVDILTLTTRRSTLEDNASIFVIAIIDIETVPKLFCTVRFLEWYK